MFLLSLDPRARTNKDGFIYTSAIKINVFMKSSALNLIEMSITCKTCFSTTASVPWDIPWLKMSKPCLKSASQGRNCLYEGTQMHNEILSNRQNFKTHFIFDDAEIL